MVYQTVPPECFIQTAAELGFLVFFMIINIENNFTLIYFEQKCIINVESVRYYHETADMVILWQHNIFTLRINKG